jgi:hypothetical protein|tara:strand:- start:1208 stop:1504 length:297 start_codon:yes stop_codon:yes gene_type:complete
MIPPTTAIRKKYSGPILLSLLFHKDIFEFSFAMALGAVFIDLHVNRNISITMALVTYFHLYAPDSVIDHEFVGAAALHNNVARRFTIYPVMLRKAFQS